MPLNHFNPPDLLASAAAQFARGFALHPGTATLLLLHVHGAVVGPSVTTRSPDMFDSTPAFDFACVDGGRAMLHGALLSAIQGMRFEILAAAGKYETTGRNELIERKKTLEAINGDLIAMIRCLDEKVTNPNSSDNLGAEMRRLSDPLQVLRNSAMPKPEQQLEELSKQLEDNNGQLAEVLITLNPGVVLESNDWHMAEAGRYSLDGHFMQIATAGSLLEETSSKSNRLKACVELLQRSRSESALMQFGPEDNKYSASLQLSGTEEEFAQLLRHPRLRNLGLLNSFVFCEADADDIPDAESFARFLEHDWHKHIAMQFRLRAAGTRKAFTLGLDGYKRYVEFREWWREYVHQLPVERRVHFLRWPELLVRLATSMAVIAGAIEDDTFEPNFVDAAAALLKNHAAHQVALLDRLMTKHAQLATLDDQVVKLVQGLRAKGPQTLRQLARGIHGQSYSVIDARLFAAIRRGLVIQKDGRFHAANVNVNASTEAEATEMEGRIAS